MKDENKLLGEFAQRLQVVDSAMLAPHVRRLLDDEEATVLNWRHELLEDGFGASYGVYRFQGQAQRSDQRQDWSLILKVLGPAQGSRKPADQDYWKREVLVYQSNLFANLPNALAVARCLGVVEFPGEEFWLWLEDVKEDGDGVWALERYGLAARHLGEFNGAYLVGKPVPALPWLLSGSFRKRLAMAEPGMAEWPKLSKHPSFVDLSTIDSVEQSQRLWGERERLLAVRDRLPCTLCHHDAFRRNLFARSDTRGEEQTVAIDWAMSGPGVIGEEIVALFAVSLIFVEFELNQIAELEALIFAGYMDGLRAAGWQGDARLARFGFTATAALASVADRAIKWPRVLKRIAALPPGAEPLRLLDAGGPAQNIARHLHLLSLGEEACALAGELA